MPARFTPSTHNARTLPFRRSGGSALAVVLTISCLPGCSPPAPVERSVDPSPAFSRPVATLGPDDAVSNGTNGVDPTGAVTGPPKAAPKAPGPGSAERMKQAIDATGKVALRIDFDTDTAALRTDAAPLIDEIAALLRKHPALKLSIDGHTDTGGDTQRNRALSEQRAETVRAALIVQGIAGDRLQARGYGADRPVADNASAEGRASNRRIELVARD